LDNTKLVITLMPGFSAVKKPVTILAFVAVELQVTNIGKMARLTLRKPRLVGCGSK
jgi:hypothetical protein